VESLSVIGDELSGRLRAELATADTRLVILDFDDTLAAWAQQLSTVMGTKLSKITKTQKENFRVRVGILSERRDTVPEGAKDVSLKQSLELIPNDDKDGWLVAGSKGARVLELQADGTDKLVAEEPGWTPEEKEKINASLDAVKAKHEFDRVSESEYGWSLIFKPELTKLSQPEQLKIAKEAAALWQSELETRGLHLEVLGRTAKDPVKNAPYLAISKGKMDKSMGVRHLMNLAGVTDPKQVVVIGDSFFEPNKTDLDMANAVPGARVFSVGGTMDPRVPRGFVYNKKGAEGTAELLDAVASGAARGAELAGRQARARSAEASRLEAQARNLRTMSELSAMFGVVGTVGILWVMFETRSILLSMLTAGSIFASIYVSKWLEDKAIENVKKAKVLRQ
jgi:hydroxymethylpyrimidine pyrophosphatase-like HAD family hydrolase